MPVYKASPNVNAELDLSGVDTTLSNNGEVYTTTLTPSAINDVFLIEFLAKVEEAQTISFMRLDAAGVSARGVRDYMVRQRTSLFRPFREVLFGEQTEWALWKEAIVKVSGQRWEEIAPLIYGSMFP
jgi:hypothetical protein